MLLSQEKRLTRIFILVSLVNFFVSASLGLLMRYAFVWEAGWMKYKNIMYAHSHSALLGWLYLILSVILWKTFGQSISTKYFTIFVGLTEISILGIILSFSFTGLGASSLFFLLFFTVISYFFSWKLWTQVSKKSDADVLLLKTSILWLVLSTLGLWALIPILLLKATDLFYMAIQFFLHFQLNGWLLFSVLAIFFNQLKKNQIEYSEKHFTLFYYLLVGSTILTFALAISWVNPDTIIFAVNSIGVLVQLLALIVFFYILKNSRLSRLKSVGFTNWMYGLALISFIAKIVIQTVIVFPDVATISYTIRLYVLGFIHLITLGMLSFYVLGYSFSSGYLFFRNKLSKSGWILLITGFIITELILFGQGTLVWFGYGYLDDYYLIIFLTSVLLPLGIILAFLGQITFKNKLFYLTK